MSEKIAIAATKGGTGKTTTTWNLGFGLALAGARVLLVDCDPQDNLRLIANTEHARSTVASALEHGTFTPNHIRETVWLLPSGGRRLWQTIVSSDGLGDLTAPLRHALSARDADYDFILLDCPPDMGVLTQSALVAAHEVIIPVDVGFFSVVGLARIVRIIDDIRNTYNPELKIAGVLATKYDPRTTLSDTTVSEIEAQGLPIFDTKIRISVDIIRSQMARTPVGIYAEGSHGAEDYNALAHEILPAKVIPLRQRQRKVADG